MNLPLIDARSFEALQAHAGADFVRALVETFAEEAQQMVRDLRDAAAQGDAEEFETAAHTLKSNAATFGATRLAELARGLEWSGPGADGSGFLPLAAELAAELAATLAALRLLARA
jgi:HPt (histidine-containing phosphotransfer) domain-containing protein